MTVPTPTPTPTHVAVVWHDRHRSAETYPIPPGMTSVGTVEAVARGRRAAGKPTACSWTTAAGPVEALVAAARLR